MAWYEETGPDAAYVRRDILNKFNTPSYGSNEWRKYSIISKETVGHILLKHIPDSKTDFGSYRGYATFGLEKNIWSDIYKDMDALIMATDTIRDKFTPYVVHWLYKPKGIRMKVIAQQTLVGEK